MLNVPNLFTHAFMVSLHQSAIGMDYSTSVYLSTCAHFFMHDSISTACIEVHPSTGIYTNSIAHF